MPEQSLTMTFDPKVIEHLGIRMYSTLPPVLAELIANSYDADATRVEVELHDMGDKRIVVKDNGVGMSLEDLDNKFLVIGRNRREEGESVTPRGRKVIGKKGLGKLSFFGIVKTVKVDTVKDGKRNVFTMDWGQLMESTDGKYVIIPEATNEVADGRRNGTTITLSNINRESDFSEENLAGSIARFFIFDENFSVSISRNNEEPVELSNKMHFAAFGEEFVWTFPDDFSHIESDYAHRSEIRGRIITPEKPIAPRFDSRGISLFSRGKLVQSPYQFADSTSSHFFSYMTGWLEVDFIEDFSEDVISTNRQNLNWGHSQTAELHRYLEKCVQFVQQDWRTKRRDKKTDKVSESLDGLDIRSWQKSLPESVRGSFNSLVTEVIDNLPEVDEEITAQIFGKLRNIIPPYPYYHWRNLHPLLKDALFEDYKMGRYIEAAKEGAVIYEDQVRRKSGLDLSGVDLMRRSFGFKFNRDRGELTIERRPILKVSDLSGQTGIDMQEGQQSLSVGLMQAFRNPATHEVRPVSRELFGFNSCLNVLSLISFLLYKLDAVVSNNG